MAEDPERDPPKFPSLIPSAPQNLLKLPKLSKGGSLVKGI